MSSILTIDIGNTAVKTALFRDERLERCVVSHGDACAPLESMLLFCSVDGAAICSVRNDDNGVAAYLRTCEMPVLELGPDTPLPICVDYDRSSLGVDRVAAACGAAGDRATLVVDSGTAVTTDLVAGGRFVGGNISPGLGLRFRSLHKFTSRLPLIEPEGELPRFGHDTDTAIRAGVMRGLTAEILSCYNSAHAVYDDLSLVLTGGDAAILLPLLREYGLDPVADPEAVGRGLVRIFNYNVSL